MKLIQIVTLVLALSLGVVCTGAAEHKPSPKEFYNRIIDQQIAFYKGRIYLTKSQYRILSDIGHDAAFRVKCLDECKADLVKKMCKRNVKLTPSKVRVFLAKEMMTRTKAIGSCLQENKKHIL